MISHRPFSSYADFQAHLDKLGLFHMDLGLDRMHAAFEAQGLARFGAPGIGPCALQVVGTNGKGSTAGFLNGMARAAGLRTGVFASPHFVSVRERVRIDGAMLDRGVWLDAANAVMADSTGGALTYFELLTVVAARLFADAGLDLVIWEAGLGGRWDATTALETSVTVFTPIGLDHCQVLGETVADIARDKAGAMRRGGLALSAVQAPAAMLEIDARAREIGATLHHVDDVVSPGTNLFPGARHFNDNARLALAALKLLRPSLGGLSGLAPGDCCDVLRAVLPRSLPPGRLQLVTASAAQPGVASDIPPCDVLLDGAHNSHALAALERALRHLAIRPRAVVFSCLRDKDFDGLERAVSALAAQEAVPIIVPELPDMAGYGRYWPAADLAARLGPMARPASNMAEALALACETGQADFPASGPVLCCGSLYLLAEFYKLRPDCLENPVPVFA